MIWFPLVIADSELGMPVIKPGLPGCYTSALTTELHEANLQPIFQIGIIFNTFLTFILGLCIDLAFQQVEHTNLWCL